MCINTSTYLIFKVLCSHLLDLRVGGEKDKEKVATICCNRVKRKKKKKKKAGGSGEFMLSFESVKVRNSNKFDVE